MRLRNNFCDLYGALSMKVDQRQALDTASEPAVAAAAPTSPLPLLQKHLWLAAAAAAAASAEETSVP